MSTTPRTNAAIAECEDIFICIYSDSKRKPVDASRMAELELENIKLLEVARAAKHRAACDCNHWTIDEALKSLEESGVKI